MKSSCSMPMEGRVHLDEFVMGGKEDKVKRIYALVIPDNSSKSLRTIFDKHISKQAQLTTD